MTDDRRAAPGRPREFDVDEALDRAVEVFWRQGYEATSLTDLTDAMHIGKPSLYAAFGNKEQLFKKALDRYTEGAGSYAVRAWARPTARDVVDAFLRGAVEATTQPLSPHGCLGVQGALATSPASQGAHDLLVEWRDAARAGLEGRFTRALEEGDLPPGSDPARLARYVVAVSFGIAVQAAGGAEFDDLIGIVDEVLARWQS
jgi:AcrR family transcriptional regulator